MVAGKKFSLIEICERTKIGDSTELARKAALHFKTQTLAGKKARRGRKGRNIRS